MKSQERSALTRNQTPYSQEVVSTCLIIFRFSPVAGIFDFGDSYSCWQKQTWHRKMVSDIIQLAVSRNIDFGL